jgi:CDGSH-type Zn-finger protein/truncated hemoglobin YjbI
MSSDLDTSAAGGTGRLARVIASRGGLAAPEAPFVIEHREALIYMLCEAAELEHGIMCQYLFAAFSLKERADEGLTGRELEAVLRWRKVISHVATEEMLHLALVHNLLSAIGAAPHLGRPNLPAPAHHYPAGVNLMLVPFGEPALGHFMFLERPEGMELEGAQGIDAPVHDAVPLMSERDIVPQPQDFATVGHLYRSIEHGFAHLAEKFGEQNLFVGPARAQATSEFFHWPELVAVTDLASAQRAIDTILEQGEGARGHWQQAHFGQFVQILGEFRQMAAANPNFQPARPVIFATVRPCEHDESVPMIGERVTSRIGDLFNVSYEILLQMLERFFAHTEETDAELETLAGATIGLMVGAIKPLGNLLTGLPVGPRYPELNAGPSFELFYENDYLMPHRSAAWALLEERVREASDFCGLIQQIAESDASTQLEPVGRALSGVADSLAAHFADWGGSSRFAAAAPAGAGKAADVTVLALASRADRLSRAVSRAARPKPALKPLASLFDEALRIFAAVAQPDPNSKGDQPSNVLVSSRLLESVLRPLAEALTGRTFKDRGERNGSGAKPKKRAAAAATVDLDEELWRLAQTATELRAGWQGGSRAGAMLIEATAALQQLSIEAALPSDRPKRLKRLRTLQRDSASEVRTAHNGPYLVTNGERMLNWLGEELPIQPQMALCRCGESALKPHCDGACARTGFRDKKDAKRVPDKRDTYNGLQLTVYDNRGICQHSGYCSDRLKTVFHTEGAFVTPSGGRMDEIIRAVRDCPSGALSYAIDQVEARAQVDWDETRPPAIEVSKDGPYRFTGSIPLVDEAGQPVKRAEGASLEHYALCRCGHSLNKPFCSGMHWYVDFRDPLPGPGTPSLYQWAGGLTALTRMTRRFYEKHVPADPLLASLYADAPPERPQRLAKWLAEVFGGPPSYSSEYGSSGQPLEHGASEALSEDERARWVALLCQSAEETLLPGDPEFQAALRSYLEWESRRAGTNSRQTADAPTEGPIPHWDWTIAGPPDMSATSDAPTDADETPVPLPAKGEPLSFETNIKPLFRERDRQSMQFAFDLWSYDDVAAHANEILDRLNAGTMPCDGPWPNEQVEVYKNWIDAGKPR